jgi:glycosyltransferase involved in cell wall biosynthesis
MRVLHVDTAREWRGGQVQLQALALSRDAEQAVAVPEDAPLSAALVADGVTVQPVAFRGELRGTAGLRAVVRTFVPDVVAAHTAHALAHALRASDVPVVAHRRVDFRPNAVGVGRLRRAARVIAVSHAVRSVLVAAGVDPDRVDVVYDGVDPPGPSGRRTTLREVLGVGRHTPVVLAVGALVEHKGHATLVDALALLPGVHAAVAGEGPLRTALLRRAARAGVADRFHLLGTRDDVPDLLKTTDVVCHPSWEEGLGQAVLEALLTGAAVVGSRAGGLPEILHGRGVLVTPRSAAELAVALEQTLTDPVSFRRAAEASFEELRSVFSTSRMISGTIAAYARSSSRQNVVRIV